MQIDTNTKEVIKGLADIENTRQDDIKRWQKLSRGQLFVIRQSDFQNDTGLIENTVKLWSEYEGTDPLHIAGLFRIEVREVEGRKPYPYDLVTVSSINGNEYYQEMLCGYLKKCKLSYAQQRLQFAEELAAYGMPNFNWLPDYKQEKEND